MSDLAGKSVVVVEDSSDLRSKVCYSSASQTFSVSSVCIKIINLNEIIKENLTNTMQTVQQAMKNRTDI